MKKGWLIGIIVVVAAAVAVWLVLRARTGETPAPPVVPTATPAPAPTPIPSPFTQVELDGSDQVVREATGVLSDSPLWVKWLAHDDLVRRFVASVNLVANGKSPRGQIPFLRPAKKFDAVDRNGDLYPDPASYRRYDRVVSIVTAVEPSKAAVLYDEMKPLFDRAYLEISKPGASFDQLLEKAILHLADTPIPAAPPKLQRKVLTYRYADGRLESLSAAQRQLLRLGPDKARAVQAWLTRFLETVKAHHAAPMSGGE